MCGRGLPSDPPRVREAASVMDCMWITGVSFLAPVRLNGDTRVALPPQFGRPDVFSRPLGLLVTPSAALTAPEAGCHPQPEVQQEKKRKLHPGTPSRNLTPLLDDSPPSLTEFWRP